MQARATWLRPLTPPLSGPRLRRALLAVALGLVALSVVGMHQLSSGHFFAAPATAHQHPTSGHAHGAGHVADLVHASGAQGTAAGTVVTADIGASAGTSSGLSGVGDGCAGCPDHTMAFTVCLLALTLLTLSWWLAPPQVRHLPRLKWRPNTMATVVSRPVPALSLAELCVLRT
jgi:hypothetical protein